MTPTFNSEFSVTLESSTAFARLSGDYNPLHVDPIAARRTQFGSTVSHGIHLFLHALDELAAQGLLQQQEPAALSATFNNPVPSGARVTLRTSLDGGKIRVAAEADGRPAFTSTIELQPASDATSAIEDAEFAPARAVEMDFPPVIREGTVPLKMSRAQLAALFPSLARLGAAGWIADLLASTQIVGMRCPGMDSIYSGFRLRRAAPSAGAPSSMQYRVSRTDERFRLARMEITGTSLAGTIETFFRPRPVAQRTMQEVAAVVVPGAFAGHRALIVGGSRGLGELTAKILAAGGADVTLTYARGKDDAARICAEARALGRACTAHELDVVLAGQQPVPEWLASSRFSHVYFFASPPIAKNSGNWSQPLFEQFARVYVAAFAALVETLAARADEDAPVHFLYPSSVFVARPEAGFAEYAVAKAAGEALCEQLQSRCRARFAKPRLPRLKTDQTNALVDVGASDPFPVMLEVVRGLHS